MFGNMGNTGGYDAALAAGTFPFVRKSPESLRLAKLLWLRWSFTESANVMASHRIDLSSSNSTVKRVTFSWSLVTSAAASRRYSCVDCLCFANIFRRLMVWPPVVSSSVVPLPVVVASLFASSFMVFVARRKSRLCGFVMTWRFPLPSAGGAPPLAVCSHAISNSLFPLVLPLHHPPLASQTRLPAFLLKHFPGWYFALLCAWSHSNPGAARRETSR